MIVTAFFTNSSDPLTSPSNVPTIRIRRVDTQVLVVTDAVMTEQGDGLYSYDFTATDGLEYVFRADGDPTAAGQVTEQERYVAGSFSGTTEARVETDIPAILVDTDTTIPALISGLNDLDQAGVQAALTAQGYTVARAGNLDDLDASISSVLAAIAALNDLDATATATAVWDALRSSHVTASTMGNSLTLLLNSIASRKIIDISANPWQERRYVFDEGSASDTVVWEAYDLFDQDGTAIAGDENSGNNPLADSDVIIAEGRRV